VDQRQGFTCPLAAKDGEGIAAKKSRIDAKIVEERGNK
jgi:hypothetical protein